MIPSRPSNFNDLSIHLELNNPISDIFKLNNKILFYDTCSISRHALANHPEHFITFFKKFDTLILLESVVYEISHGHNIQPQYIDYFRRLKSEGIKVYLLDESKIATMLHTQLGIKYYVDAIHGLNTQAGHLIRDIQQLKFGTLKKYLDLSTVFTHTHMHPNVLNKVDYFETVMKHIWSQKRSGVEGKSGDSLAEEIMMMLTHFLLVYLSIDCYILSDDKNMVSVLKQYQNRPRRKKDGQPDLITSMKMLSNILSEPHSYSENDLIKTADDLSVTDTTNKITLLVNKELAAGVEIKKITPTELIENILHNPNFTIKY
jgi:hypothetical protein